MKFEPKIAPYSRVVDIVEDVQLNLTRFMVHRPGDGIELWYPVIFDSRK